MGIKLVECIPNFSEARKPDAIDAIVEAAGSISGVRILDRHSDLDHNRTVLTFIGAPEAVEEAAFQAIAKAASLIDLEQHQGEHPRIGATDVVPFVPIEGVSMVDCVEMARRLGKRVAEELNIPVYLYEEASVRPDRINLEDIRRGQYELLKTAIQTDPLRAPDFGPCQLGSAGATVIGARSPLIAYNIYLTTDDVSIADKIARRVRNSSGGFHYVKAMGVLVEGRAQVSMNLTNFKRSPMAQITEMIRREAQRYGVSVHHSEIVGLIPNAALLDAAKWYMQMDQFAPEQVLESRLYADLAAVQPLEKGTQESSLLDDIAAGTPSPGGGSASAHTAATAAALVAMVARLTVNKKKYDSIKDRMYSIIEEAESLRVSLSKAVAEDAASFDGILQAMRLPKETPEQQEVRSAAIEQATIFAAQVPLETCRLALKVMELAIEVAASGNLNAITDAGSAAALAFAAQKGAGYNVKINLSGIEKPLIVQPMLDEVNSICARAEDLDAAFKRSLKERANI